MKISSTQTDQKKNQATKEQGQTPEPALPPEILWKNLKIVDEPGTDWEYTVRGASYGFHFYAIPITKTD
jgi:hypothetical protein